MMMCSYCVLRRVFLLTSVTGLHLRCTVSRADLGCVPPLLLQVDAPATRSASDGTSPQRGPFTREAARCRSHASTTPSLSRTSPPRGAGVIARITFGTQLCRCAKCPSDVARPQGTQHTNNVYGSKCAICAS
eukprot:1195872-Prorocentrum_minimum.AAC.1